jgi:hypothetical protein
MSFNFNRQVRITNKSGGPVTDPVIELHLIPYSPIQLGAWTVDGEVYNYRIPIQVNEMSGDNLTDYLVKVGPIDTKWLVDNGWATATGNEVRFTDSDGNLLPFWLEKNPGWNDHATYYWVQMNLDAWEHATIYMFCDPDLSGVSSASVTTIFDYFNDFDGTYPAVLVGDTDSNAVDVAASSFVVVRRTAGTSGTMTHIRIRCGVAGNIKAAIYSDNGSGTAPTGTVLAQRAASFACVVGVNYIPLDSNCEIANGTIYWLSFIIATAGVVRRTSATGVGTAKYKDGTLNFSTFTFPDVTSYSWTGNLTYQYAIAGIDVGLNDWAITGNLPSNLPSITGSVVTVASGAISSIVSYSKGKAVRMYARVTHCVGPPAGIARLGFRKDANDNLDFEHSGTYAQTIMASNGGSVTFKNDQEPFPLSEWAMWEVKWRAATTNKDSFGRFEVNNQQCQDSDGDGSPLWSNMSAQNLPITMNCGYGSTIECGLVLVRSVTSPEPIVNVPQIYHHPKTVFLNSLCEHWPYDLGVKELGSESQLYYHLETDTLSSEYATVMYVKYIGTIADEESITLEILFGDADQDEPSEYWDATHVFDFWDDWNLGDESQWTEVSGSWGTSDQQKPQIFDYHLMNTDPAASSIWCGTQTWIGNDGVERMIAFVGLGPYAGRMFPTPWELVLYEKHGDSWYRWGNVLTAEYNGINHASIIPYWMWEGDGSYMGHTGWLYLLVSTTTIQTGEFASWIFVNKDRTGRSWEVLNEGMPFADKDTVAGTDLGRYTQLVYHNGAYIVIYCQSPWTCAKYLYANAEEDVAAITAMLNQTGTISPSIWTDGGNFSDVSSIEEAHVYQLADNSWIMMWEYMAGTRYIWYSTCSAANFGVGMDAGDWSAPAKVQNLDIIYEWSRSDVATPKGVVGGASPNLIFEATPYLAGYALGFAHSDTFAGTSFALQNIDKMRYQANNAGWKISVATDKTLGDGNIVSVAMVGGAAAGYYAGVVWRYQDADNFLAFLVNADLTRLSYGKMVSGVWTTLGSYNPGITHLRGKEFRLWVEFDGPTTTLKYALPGWEWVTAFDSLNLTQASTGIAESGGIGTVTYNAYGFFDDFRTFALAPLDVEPIRLCLADTLAATNITTTSAMVNGEIADDGGEACAGRFAYWKEGEEPQYTEWTDYVLNTHDLFHANLSALDPVSTYYVQAQAKNSAGEGPWGNEESFETKAQLAFGLHPAVAMLVGR